MLPNCSEYKRRLLRMKTLGPDFELAQAVTQNSHLSDRKVCSASDQHSSALVSKEKTAYQRTSSSKYDSSELWMRRNPDRHHRRRESRSRRHRGKSALKQSQLQQPLLTSAASDDLESDMETQVSRLDCKTNKSRRCGSGATVTSFGHRGGGVTTAVNNSNSARSPDRFRHFNYNDFHDLESTSDSDLEHQNSNAGSSEDRAEDMAVMEDPTNRNAVAKGANALVKSATSRQTEIIDISQLQEGGKVETEYEEDEPEVIEETDYKLIDDYEKTFAYARRLRALLNMQFKLMNRGNIETNFMLVKAHEHPTQKVIDRWRNVDMGKPYDSQIRQQNLINDFKASLVSKRVSKKAELETYPEWVKFYFRFRKDHSDQRWLDFIAHKQKMNKESGGNLTVPNAADKYSAAYYDVWSTSVVVFAKPNSILQNMVDPVFAKLGLEARADFKFTIGCFIGDTRTGKAKASNAPNASTEVPMQTTCTELYKKNCNEVFVNENRVEMFNTFPNYYPSAGRKLTQYSGRSDSERTSKRESKVVVAEAAENNQSNLETESELALQHNRAPARCVYSSGGCKSTKSDATERRWGETVSAKMSAAVKEFEDRSTPSATNQNLSVHECDFSDDYESQPTVDGSNSTTNSGRS